MMQLTGVVVDVEDETLEEDDDDAEGDERPERHKVEVAWLSLNDHYNQDDQLGNSAIHDDPCQNEPPSSRPCTAYSIGECPES